METVGDARAYLDSTLLAACLRAKAGTPDGKSCDAASIPPGRRRSSRRSGNGPLSPSSLDDFSRHQDDLLSACLAVLAECELITIDGDGEKGGLRPTPLGRAVLSSALGPVDGLAVFGELSKARRSVALDTDLHLVYMVSCRMAIFA